MSFDPLSMAEKNATPVLYLAMAAGQKLYIEAKAKAPATVQRHIRRTTGKIDATIQRATEAGVEEAQLVPFLTRATGVVNRVTIQCPDGEKLTFRQTWCLWKADRELERVNAAIEGINCQSKWKVRTTRLSQTAQRWSLRIIGEEGVGPTNMPKDGNRQGKGRRNRSGWKGKHVKHKRHRATVGGATESDSTAGGSIAHAAAQLASDAISEGLEGIEEEGTDTGTVAGLDATAVDSPPSSPQSILTDLVSALSYLGEESVASDDDSSISSVSGHGRAVSISTTTSDHSNAAQLRTRVRGRHGHSSQRHQGEIIAISPHPTKPNAVHVATVTAASAGTSDSVQLPASPDTSMSHNSNMHRVVEDTDLRKVGYVAQGNRLFPVYTVGP